MKVKDLIAELEKYDGDIDVLLCCEDAEVLKQDDDFRLFAIHAINNVEIHAEKPALPAASFTPNDVTPSSPHLVIDITADF